MHAHLGTHNIDSQAHFQETSAGNQTGLRDSLYHNIFSSLSGPLNSNVKATWQDSGYHNSFQLDYFYPAYKFTSTIRSPSVIPHTKNFHLCNLFPDRPCRLLRVISPLCPEQ
ncbi:hypothetical protein ILYODFUR_016613 [Ilyodon furcidens]|uniref:Uncharacterized protein n=1 Tax=Ilyodon furcidens TaxID=33524 RepID=A0ABV0U5X1_9TELE